jgi:hypothetical protein
MVSDRDPGPEVEGEPPALTCAVCCKEIPPSEDFMSEARDYVLYLCGVDCYAEWHKYAEDKVSREKAEETP